ncbi:hypothetical protein LP414_30975 [Polaromonas sp. P1(28)-13]|nr:hypothetical protein LP414_30975 [Polaromonas sp. P1(28)-13]
MDFCEVDHGYPVANPEWYESSIQCDDCAKQFLIEQRGQQFFLLARKEVDERKALADTAQVQLRAIRSDPEVSLVVKKFVSMVDGLSSVAAIFRFLAPLGMTRGSLPTFRKHWRGAERLVERPSPHEFRAIFDAMGADKAWLHAHLSEIEALEASSRVPVPSIGAAVYVL